MRLVGVTSLAMGAAIGIRLPDRPPDSSALSGGSPTSPRASSDGDLTQRVDVTSSDRDRGAGGGLRRDGEKLRQVVGALQDSVRLLKQAGDDLGASTRAERDHHRQATALQETQVTAQEIKQTSLLAAQKAEAVLKLPRRRTRCPTRARPPSSPAWEA